MVVMFFRYVLLMVGLTDRIRGLAGDILQTTHVPTSHCYNLGDIGQPKPKSQSFIHSSIGLEGKGVTGWACGAWFYSRFNLSPLGLRDPGVQRNCVRY